jgi:flagellar motor component MotA
MLSKYLGLLICLFLVISALFQIGIFLYVDINSILIVFGGAFGYSLIQNKKGDYITNYGKGAIFLGGWQC